MPRDPVPPATVHVSLGENDDFGLSFRVRDKYWKINLLAGPSNIGFGSTYPLEPVVQMKATIFHNPSCGTSRKTLDMLRENCAEVSVVEYLKTPPSRTELQRLYDRAGISARDGLRDKEPLADQLGLKRPEATESEILDAMMAHPILINRPLVETEKGVRLCRPQDVVREIL